MRKRTLKNQLALNVIFIILCILIVFPLLLVISVSVSSETDIINNGYKLIPEHFDLSAYKYIFKNSQAVMDAYGITILSSVLFTLISVSCMSGVAYMLSKRNLKGNSFFSFYLFFTMLFSGGLVPSYILITQYLHLDDTLWVHIIPGVVSPWYVFMIRTFFQGLPQEILESARVDGANQYTIFFRIVIPLSKSVIAAVSLFMFLGKWNDWNTSMLYINNNERLISLQYLLQRIMQNIKVLQDSGMDTEMMSDIKVPSETVRMAMAVVVAGPALLIFPFFQKYFVKGMTVGAVKG